MKIQNSAIPFWSTTANNHSAENLPPEASILCEHLHLCKQPYGGLYGVVCAADAMHGFAVSRFMTTLFVVASLIVVSSLVI